MDIVYRVQDREGRGPFKPGFSHRWVQDRPDLENLQPWYVEFGRVDSQVLTGSTCGSACRTLEQLRRWFLKNEYATLQAFGYFAVEISVDRVIAESRVQCFVSRALPFNVDLNQVRLY